MSNEAALQTSRICYVPQPYFTTEGSCTVSAHDNIDEILNGEGLLNPDLSDFTTIIADSGVSDFQVRVGFYKDDSWLVDSNITCGFIGCTMLTYEDDGGGDPDLSTVFSEDIIMTFNPNSIGTVGNQQMTYAHNSQNSITSFCQEPLPGIIAGGTSNLLFHDLGTGGNSNGVLCTLIFSRQSDDVTARPHARMIIGHMFIGVDIEVNLNPRTFAWRISANSDKFKSRDNGTIPNEGVLLRQSSAEILRIPNNDLIGSVVVDPSVSPWDVEQIPNLMDLTKVNNGYPILFSPYPNSGLSPVALTAEKLNLTARQNFFSIYGYMNRPIEVLTNDYNDGLDTLYRANFGITETR